jgi:hypothetical protein
MLLNSTMRNSHHMTSSAVMQKPIISFLHPATPFTSDGSGCQLVIPLFEMMPTL